MKRKTLFERLGRAVQSLARQKRMKLAERVVFGWYEKYGHSRAKNRGSKHHPSQV